jgi:hypothetical protein
MLVTLQILKGYRLSRYVRLFYRNRENLRKHKHSERDQRQARAKMVPLSGAGEYYNPAW